MVEIETDEGLVGVGETDLNAWIARACIEAPGTHTMDQGLRALLLGRDPRRSAGDLARPLRRHRHDGAARRARERDRRHRHRPLGHLRPGGGRSHLEAARRGGADAAADAVRLAAAGGVVVRGVRDVDRRLGAAGARARLHRREARGDVRRAVRAQGPARAGRVDRRGGARGARGGRAGDDPDGRRAVRVRLGRAGAALRRSDRAVRRVLPRDAPVGRRSRRLRGAGASLAGADRPGRVADDEARVRRAPRRVAGCRWCSRTSAASAACRRRSR